MGEYAVRKSDGENVKIGTCEDMYYLRYDQRKLVKATRGNVDPVADVRELRFRFPWPDEDGTKPGSFDGDFQRSIPVPGFVPYGEADHGTIQFSARPGYLVSLPCPESVEGRAFPHQIHRNGMTSAPLLYAQKFRDGIGLVPILRCCGCGSMWREEDPKRIEEIAVLLRQEADHKHNQDAGYASFLHTVADRVLAGLNWNDGTPYGCTWPKSTVTA